MAHQTSPTQNSFCYQSFSIDKSQPLGHGAYGAVYVAKCDQLPCAAKVLHPTIVDPSNHDPGRGKVMERFHQECSLLERIRHPNIVQYLAVTVDPESKLSVLLMELLDENLTKMLERSQQPLAYYIQVDICHDIALAIAYLHSNGIIHRDLSSNNVLIIAERRAKVTDFGMSKLVGTMTPLTVCPGTPVYMPPEALREPPRYTKMLDCFSEGVIMIQMCTRLWPEPGPRTQLVPFPASPTGMTEVPVLEPERRKNHIDLIDPTHPLLPIAVDCLHFQEAKRPTSEELCQRLGDLKHTEQYQFNLDQYQGEVNSKDDRIAELTQQLHEKDRLLCEFEETVLTGEQIQLKREMVAETDRIIRQKESQYQVEMAFFEVHLQQLYQELEEQEQIRAEIQQTNHSLQRQVEQLQQQLSQQVVGSQHQSPQVGGNISPPEQLRKAEQKPRSLISKESMKTLEWRDGGKAPFRMVKGAATVDRNVAYFMGWNGKVCSYNSTSGQWITLPSCPYISSTLVVIDGSLTTIGGCTNIFQKNATSYTNKLLSLRDGWFRKGWSAVFPPMSTKRRSSTAVTWKEHLIVAGGTTGPKFADNVNTVEVMDTINLVWSTVANLPRRCNLPSATICGERLYLLGSFDDENITKSVLTCSLTELLQSSASSSSLSVWHRVAEAPTYSSSCVAISDQLLAVGGHDKDFKATPAVHQYSPATNSWDHISDIPTARYNSLVAVLPTNEMIVVGGIILHAKTDEVEIANLS